MSKILEAVTEKIKTLDEECVKVDTKICFGPTKIPVPPTDVGRTLLRALLIEIRRYEKDKIDNQLRILKTIAEQQGK